MKKTAFNFGIPVLLVLSLALFGFAEKVKRKKRSYQDGKFSVECEMLYNLYDGKYVSYYPNKQKKAEGNFVENQRVGKWTAWDSTGKMVMQREYKNNFEFTRLYPSYPQGTAQLFSAPVYKLNYNANGYIDYFFLQERACAVSKRIWRYVPKEKNPQVFQYNQFLPTLLDSVKAGKIFGFDIIDDEFRKKLEPGVLNKYADTALYSLIGYKIKEDWFFDLDRMISETRMIGLLPVLREKSKGDTIELAWFYYPQVRAIAAKQMHDCNAVNQNASTLDNVFFFRNFYGEIYKESNVKNRSLKEYASGLMLEQERTRIELSMIELEHDEWLRLAP